MLQRPCLTLWLPTLCNSPRLYRMYWCCMEIGHQVFCTVRLFYSRKYYHYYYYSNITQFTQTTDRSLLQNLQGWKVHNVDTIFNTLLLWRKFCTLASADFRLRKLATLCLLECGWQSTSSKKGVVIKNSNINNNDDDDEDNEQHTMSSTRPYDCNNLLTDRPPATNSQCGTADHETTSQLMHSTPQHSADRLQFDKSRRSLSKPSGVRMCVDPIAQSPIPHQIYS